MGLLYIAPFAFNFIEWIRDNILQPFIEIIADVIIKLLMVQLQILFSFLIAQWFIILNLVYVAILKVVDVCQTVFYSLSGAEKLSYSLGAEKGKDYLSNIILRIPQVKTVFWSIWLLSLVLCIVFLIAAVIRSMSHLDDTGQSVGDVMRQAAGTILMFMVVQIVAYCTLSLSNILITGTQTAMNYSMGSTENVRLSNAIFAASAINAVRTGDAMEDSIVGNLINNITSTVKGSKGKEVSEDYWKNAWAKVKGFYSGKLKYYDPEDVNKTIVAWKIDYLSAAVCVIFVLKYMLGAAIALVQRVLSIVVAYVTAPFFVAMSPLDGGARFQRWKDYFIGTCFGAIGILLSVRIYTMILPFFLENNVVYSGKNYMLGYLTRLYSVVIISYGFEKLGDIVNKIISDAGGMTPSEAFGIIMSFVQNVDSIMSVKKSKSGSVKLPTIK